MKLAVLLGAPSVGDMMHFEPELRCKELYSSRITGIHPGMYQAYTTCTQHPIIQFMLSHGQTTCVGPKYL